MRINKLRSSLRTKLRENLIGGLDQSIINFLKKIKLIVVCTGAQ